MLNIIKMYLFRLLKSRGFYFIIAIIAVIAWFNVYYISNCMSTENRKKMLSEEARDSWNIRDSEQLFLGINYDIGLLIDGKGTITVFNEASILLSSSIIPLFTGIFTILFASEECSCGYIKNLLSCVKKRRYLVISKIAAIAIIIAIEFAVLLLVTELASLLYLKQFFHSVTMEQLRYIGLQFLLYTAYSSLIMMVALTLKNQPVGIILNMFLSMNFGSIINFYFYNILAGLFNNIVLVNSLNYYIVPNIVMMSVNAPLAVGIRSVLIALAAILIYNSISIAVIEKSDI